MSSDIGPGGIALERTEGLIRLITMRFGIERNELGKERKIGEQSWSLNDMKLIEDND